MCGYVNVYASLSMIMWSFLYCYVYVCVTYCSFLPTKHTCEKNQSSFKKMAALVLDYVFKKKKQMKQCVQQMVKWTSSTLMTFYSTKIF